jgi:hypothetical protein
LSNYSEEASRQLFRSRDDKSNPLRSFVKVLSKKYFIITKQLQLNNACCHFNLQKIKKGCKKLAAKLSCADTTYAPPLHPMLSRSQTASMSTRATSARAASSSVRTPQYTGKGPADVDDEDEALQYSTTSGDDDDDELQWEFTGHEEMGTSQLGGAPIGTQGVEYTQEEYTHVEHQVPMLCFYFSIFA